MARKRMIDPTIWEDENFGRMSPRGRICFIGLFSNADDEGRIRLNPAYIRSTIFIYDEITLNETEKVIQEVVDTMKHLHVYDEKGNKFCHIGNWDTYQKQKTDRISPSALPPCHICNISPVTVMDIVSDDDVKEKTNLPLRIRITQRDKGCRYCGLLFPSNATRWVMEHVVPKSKGGLTNDDNLVLACQQCNSQKSNHTPDEVGMVLKSVSEMEDIWKQNGRHLETEVKLSQVKLSQVKLSKDKLSEVKCADEKSAAQLLHTFNEVFGTKYTTTDPLVPNLEYWLKSYTIGQILEAVKNAKYHHYWKDKLTPEILLRRKNPNGEMVDRIGEMLNYQSKAKKGVPDWVKNLPITS